MHRSRNVPLKTETKDIWSKFITLSSGTYSGQDNMKNIYMPSGHADLKSTCPPLNPASRHYLFIAFTAIFDMPIGHVNFKFTCPSQKSTCPGRSGSHLFAPCIYTTCQTKMCDCMRHMPDCQIRTSRTFRTTSHCTLPFFIIQGLGNSVLSAV